MDPSLGNTALDYHYQYSITLVYITVRSTIHTYYVQYHIVHINSIHYTGIRIPTMYIICMSPSVVLCIRCIILRIGVLLGICTICTIYSAARNQPKTFNFLNNYFCSFSL